MKRFRLVLTWMLLLQAAVCLSASCAPTPPATVSDFAYADAPFTAVVRGTYTPADGSPRPVAATVTVGTPTDGGRNMTVSFAEPPALAGVTVTATANAASVNPPDGGGRTVTFTAASDHGEVTASATHGELDGFLRFAEALLPCGDVVEVSPVAEDGNHTVLCRTAEGDREAVYLFSQAGGLPLRVTVQTAGETLELAVNRCS